MGLQEEEEVIKERSLIAERIRSNGGRIQEDRCRMYTGGLVSDVYRRTGAGSIQREAVSDLEGRTVSD